MPWLGEMTSIISTTFIASDSDDFRSLLSKIKPQAFRRWKDNGYARNAAARLAARTWGGRKSLPNCTRFNSPNSCRPGSNILRRWSFPLVETGFVWWVAKVRIGALRALRQIHAPGTRAGACEKFHKLPIPTFPMSDPAHISPAVYDFLHQATPRTRAPPNFPER